MHSHISANTGHFGLTCTGMGTLTHADVVGTTLGGAATFVLNQHLRDLALSAISILFWVASITQKQPPGAGPRQPL